jgi:hypothetical protein
MRRIRFPQPYRGQAREKVYGYPSPPKPYYWLVEYIFWFIFAIVGIGILGFAIFYVATRQDFTGFFVFILYLVFLLIAIFAFKDAKQIETITSDEDVQENNDKYNDPSEDRFIEVEEMSPDRTGRYASRWHQPLPRWRYRITGTKSKSRTNRFNISIFLGMGVFVGIVVIFGASPALIIGLITVICLTLLTAYLMKD